MADSPDDRLANEPSRRVGAARLRAEPEPDEDAPPAPPSLLLPRASVNVYMPGVRCPYCMELVEYHGASLNSGLGPPVLLCRKCGRRFLSRRREWIDMGLTRKAWFIAVSGLYAAGLAGWAAGNTLLALLLVGPWRQVWVYVLHASGWAAAVVAFQSWRVVRSLRRTCSGERHPYRLSFWSPDFGWLGFFLRGMYLTTAALAWLARVLKW